MRERDEGLKGGDLEMRNDRNRQYNVDKAKVLSTGVTTYYGYPQWERRTRKSRWQDERMKGHNLHLVRQLGKVCVDYVALRTVTGVGCDYGSDSWQDGRVKRCVEFTSNTSRYMR